MDGHRLGQFYALAGNFWIPTAIHCIYSTYSQIVNTTKNCVMRTFNSLIDTSDGLQHRKKYCQQLLSEYNVKLQYFYNIELSQNCSSAMVVFGKGAFDIVKIKTQ